MKNIQVPTNALRSRLSAGILAATFAAFLLLLLPGCQNPLQQRNRGDLGTVSLRFGGPEGRTIRPPTPYAGDFARFELVFTSGGGTSLEPLVWDDGRTYGDVELAVGQWSLEVSAFIGADDTEPSATGVSGTFTVGAGGHTPIVVPLFPFYDGGTGTFAWNLELDPMITMATMSVYPYGAAIAAWGPSYLRGGPDTVGYDGETGLPAGRYIVVLTLDDGERTITVTEALHVYRNLESLFDYFFGSANFAECPASYIMDAILNAWDGTRWDFEDVGIRAGHFAFLEDEGVLFGVGTGNFGDVVYWFGRFAGSIPAPADFGPAELGVLVDAALIGAGTGGDFVSAVDYWGDAQAEIEAMAANDTGLAFFWDGYYRVLNVGIGGTGLGSADDADYAVTVEFEQSLLPPVDPHELAGRLLILQAGASGGDGAIGRSFIELYNNTAEDIVLDGFTLQYAAGASTNAAWAATETAPWTAIPLTGTIPARGSFLVAGNLVGNPANQRFTITDNEADVVADMRLSNRSFKVALMASPYRLRVANPSAMPRGGAAAGFIDLLGALNSPPGDGVDAFETAPAAVISQQASARRRSLVDTDDNSVDFVRVDFRHLPGEGTPSNAGGTSIADFERVRPKNSSHGAWAPFGYPAHPLAGRLLILQAGAAGTDGAIGRSFIELYNNTAEDIDLDGFTLQFAAGSSTNAAWLSPVTAPWTAIPLTGTIPARGSFLVAGHRVTDPANQRFTITDDEADVVADMRLSNRSFKVALMASPDTLAVANPFAMPGWGTVEGFVDLLGALNSPPGDGVDAVETAPAVVISQQASARRRSLVDTDDNSADFVRVDFRHVPGEGTPSNAGGTSIADFERVRPRSSHDGLWTPFPEVDDSPVAGESPYAGRLLILQVGAAYQGAIGRSFIEMYNTTDIPINLDGFSLQFANAVGTNWTVIPLVGTIPARGSFLVVGRLENPGGRLQIADADQIIPNNGRLSTTQFKVALMDNLNRLTVANPFAIPGGGRADGFVDMVGAANAGASIDAYETTPAGPISSQMAIRRRSLADTNNNGVDFVRIDYRTDILEHFRPRSSSNGTWEPFQIAWGEGTGLPSIHISIAPHERGGPNSLDRHIWRPTTVSLRGTGTYAALAFEGVSAEARGRGNSSWTWRKRPLRIRFNTARPMFGSSYAARDWTLIANAIDHSMMRTYAAYFLGSLLSGIDFSPTGHFLHLYMDGEYRGVYMLSDQIHVHPGRVQLTSNLDPTLSEYFLEWCARVPNEGGPYFTVSGIHFGIEYPGSGILNQNLGHRQFVENFIAQVYAALVRGDFDEISEIIDIGSFIDFYLVQELFKNQDVGFSSVFLQVRRTDTGHKLFAGPLWDFDRSSGILNIANDPSPQGVWAATRNRFLRYLMNTDRFKEQVGVRWNEIRSNEVVAMTTRLIYLAQKYQVCFERNFERWPDKNVTSAVNIIDLPFMEQVEFLVDWLQQRKVWLDGFLQ